MLSRSKIPIASAGAVAAIVALLAISGAWAHGTASAGLIVFPAMTGDANTPQLFAVQPSGGGLTQLTTGAAPPAAPTFSPDGKRIAFARLGYGIYTVNRDGTGLKRLTTSNRDSDPTFSPDGKKLAFVRPQGSAWKLFVMRSAGGKPTFLRKSPAAGRPVWTAMGLLVATQGDLVRVDPTTGAIIKYYDANLDAIWGLHTIAIAPDLKLLTYWGSRDPVAGDKECGEGVCQQYGLFLESLIGKKKVGAMIVKNAGPAVFSPDGKSLAFVVNGAVTLRNIATGAQTQIATPGITPVTSTPLAWR